MAWFIACGDETCSRCKLPIKEDAEAYYDTRTDKTFCTPCEEKEEDELAGRCDAEDPRYNDDDRL